MKVFKHFGQRITGFIVGAAASYCLFTATHRDVLVEVPVEKQVFVSTKEALAAEQGEKNIVNKFTEARIYAGDGSYFLATLEQYIELNIGDDVSSNNWKMPEHPPDTPGVLWRDADKPK